MGLTIWFSVLLRVYLRVCMCTLYVWICVLLVSLGFVLLYCTLYSVYAACRLSDWVFLFCLNEWLRSRCCWVVTEVGFYNTVSRSHIDSFILFKNYWPFNVWYIQIAISWSYTTINTRSSIMSTSFEHLNPSRTNMMYLLLKTFYKNTKTPAHPPNQ